MPKMDWRWIKDTSEMTGHVSSLQYFQKEL